MLARLDSTQALYLGDFGRWTHVRSSRLPGSRRLTWNAPFACGGGGTVLSAAAARRVDFMACAHRFRKTCFQSDWAIGVCLAERSVIPMLNLSCGMCNLLHCSSSKGMEVHALMRLQALTSGAQGYAEGAQPSLHVALHSRSEKRKPTLRLRDERSKGRVSGGAFFGGRRSWCPPFALATAQSVSELFSALI